MIAQRDSTYFCHRKWLANVSHELFICWPHFKDRTSRSGEILVYLQQAQMTGISRHFYFFHTYHPAVWTWNTTVFFPLLHEAVNKKSLHVRLLALCLWCQIAAERVLNVGGETCIYISRRRHAFAFTGPGSDRNVEPTEDPEVTFHMCPITGRSAHSLL